MQRLQQQFHALGSEIFITLVADDDFPFKTIFHVLHGHISTFEQRFSRFLPKSELSMFNTDAGKDTKVSTEFLELLLKCRLMMKATDGLYNPFILPALQKAGYKGSWPTPRALAGAPDFSSRQIVPFTELKISSGTARIPANTALDFGGIGKGYLLDKLAEYLQSKAIVGYWLSLGGDIVCAGHDLNGQTWSIQVQHAARQEEKIAALTNTNGSPLFIATSGVTKRRGENGKDAWHHIIDPRTGLPAETNILTATVTSDTGVNADVYAKVIVIAGYEQAKSLKDNGGIHAYILQYSQKEPTVEL